MTAAYLILSLLGAILTFNLFWPVTRQATLAIPSFLFGWLSGELIGYLFTAQILGTLLFAATGAIVGPWGAAGLLLSFLSWIGMAIYLRSALRTGFETEQALTAGLGAHYQNEILPHLLKKIPEKPSLLRVIRPFSPHLPQVQRLRDLVYHEENGTTLTLDIYRHRQAPQNAPVLLQIHGGGWTEKMGSKNEQGLPLMNELAAMGWICVAINYRLSPAVTFPTHVIDCKRGLAWVKTHIGEYGGDPDFIVLTGGSAGGHLCALLALTANRADLQPGFTQIDTSVQGCVPFYGIYDLANESGLHNNSGLSGYVEKTVMGRPRQEVDLYRGLSPLHNIHQEAPPFLIIHGTTDSLTSFREARHFATELAAVSRRQVVFAPIRYAQHAFDLFRSPRSERVMFAVARFASYLYSLYLKNNKNRG